MSGNSISLDAATRQTMAAIKQHMAANAAMMSNILIMVYPPFRSLIQTLALIPIQTPYSVKVLAGFYTYLWHQLAFLTIDRLGSPVLSPVFSKWINSPCNVL